MVVQVSTWIKVLAVCFIFHSALTFSHTRPSSSSAAEPSQDVQLRAAPKMKILIGVLTMAYKLERRNLLRMAYGVQSLQNAHVTVRFVLGKPKNDEERTLVGMELLHHKDIMMLDCEENLNEGKTFAFFYSVAASSERFDYVMKTDDDSYVRIENLAHSLQDLPRDDLYYGYLLPENVDPYKGFMAGMGYLISWDLVEWIKTSPIPNKSRVGIEDILVGDWFNAAGKAKTRVHKWPMFYDHPEFGGYCAHALTNDTILVHKIKTLGRWIHVLSYFEGYRFPSDAGVPVATSS